ncbi:MULTISPECIES: hypothetical protein [Cyanophyceae]|uniref:hypothetical protein n=1 Tax=Cyanophyceae TaxID=3028117 RepID=UPI00016DCC3A|nr:MULTISPECIES: hypothetical protein [Cyanophyceae]ACB00068.1 conserved hypothetical protein [Picosynechococcus sp. PCC 7002]SMH53832.1 hypothetical protein SAMN06272755_2713 [Picosynechococcus sp. OG1]SMQ82769.1 hypothetical protein SAMN06272774_1989 [Synechococcus sp. 7002]
MAQSVPILKQIQVALAAKDYSQMRQLLLQWQKVEPKNPWFRLYVARWYEATEQWQKAEKGYRRLLKGVTVPKVVTQARQGLARLEARALALTQTAIAEEKAAPGGEVYGLMVLEPISPKQKKTAAQYFATVLRTDAYSAGLQLPLKSWRLFRTGALGELRFLKKALTQGNIPSFCLSLAQLQNIPVIQVQTIEQLDPHLLLRGLDETQQAVEYTVPWSEISQWVTGMLPIFEESLEKDGRGKPYYKTKVLDYAQFCDLHWGDRQVIFRLNDQHYQFQQGLSFLEVTQNPIEQLSNRRNWNQMQHRLTEHLSHSRKWSDFKSFANNARDFPELLRKIQPQVNLFRQETHQDTYWDPAWHLYSTIIFAHGAETHSEAIAQKN